MPKVSVIVPNYNHAAFLEQRLQSIFAQTFQDFEVILLDDASSDNSKVLLEAYRHHPRVSHVVYNKSNSGSPFAQWNKGVALAKGEYIWVAESDDFSAPSLLQQLVPQLDANPEASLAYCLSADVDETGNEVTARGWWTADLDTLKWTNDHRQNGAEACRKYFVYKNVIPNASAVVFRKSVFQNLGGAPAHMTMCGDWYMWILMLLKHDYFYLAQALNFQRRHSGTTRTIKSNEKALRKISEELEVYYLLDKNFREDLPPNNRVNDCFINWVTIAETEKKFSSFYRWPPFHNSNWIVYFKHCAKLKIYPFYRYFKTKR
jgi:glycosyltransferase involved in cell wall biosynthesis